MNKLSGGSLFHALAVSIIIGMLMSCVILAEYYHRCLLRQNLVKEEVIRNAESGIVYLCGNGAPNSNAEMAESENTEIDLFGRGKDSVHCVRKTWGAYDVCISTAHTGNESFERIAMIGTVPVPENKFALWLADMDRELSITGTTRLNGKCFLPKAGVERAYIEGRSYTGRELVYGSTAESSRFAPPFASERMELLEKLFDGNRDQQDSLVMWQEISDADTIAQSFSQKQLTIVSDGIILLSGHCLRGQVLLHSSKAIVVDKTSSLQNVILVAPRIEIRNDVEGIFQAFAIDSLIVGTDVHLGYPTTLGIVPAEKAINNPALILGTDSYITGEIFLACEMAGINRQGFLVMKKKSTVEGAVHCYGNLDMQGTVLGSVTCQKFVLKTNSAVYENHLMDAVIDIDQRSEFWLGSLLFNEPTSRNVIQWLN